MESKKLHLRKCVSCNEMKTKDELFRVVRIDDKAMYDSSYKLNGRGAYVCKNSNCILLAEKRKQFSRGLKCKVDDSIYKTLLMELENEAR